MRAHLPRILTAVVIVAIVAAAGCTSTAAPSPAAAARADFDKAAAKAVAAWSHGKLAQGWHTEFIPLQVFTVVPTVPDLAAPSGTACGLVGRNKTITVTLAAPVGTRPLLDLVTGYPAQIDAPVLGPAPAA